MLRTTSGLSRSVVKWISQVAASVGATLVATMIYSALPRPVFSIDPAPQPELTSGGKFAARAWVPVADDGLDAMPLPHVAPMPVVPTPAPAEAPAPIAPMRRAAGDGAAPPMLAPERSAHAMKPMRATARVEPRRALMVAEAPASSPPLAPAEPASDTTSQDRIMPRIVPVILSTARDVWRLTASAGGTLMAHVVPQIP